MKAYWTVTIGSSHRSVSLCLALIENFIIFSFPVKHTRYYRLVVWSIGRALCQPAQNADFLILGTSVKRREVSFLEALGTCGNPGCLKEWESGTKDPCVFTFNRTAPSDVTRTWSLCAMLGIWLKASCQRLCSQKEPWRPCQHNPSITQMLRDLQWDKS